MTHDECCRSKTLFPICVALLIMLIKPLTAAENSNYNQFFEMTFAYLVSSKACGNPEQISKMETSFDRVKRIGQKKGFLNQKQRFAISNLEAILPIEIQRFRKTARMSCGEVGRWVEKIDAMTRGAARRDLE